METLERVMHVDDDDSIRTITAVTLETVGNLKVLSCESGFEALEKYGRFQPQAILLDVMMPDMDGPATLEALQSKFDLENVMVLFMTAKVQQAELDYYREAGGFGVILKPFDPMALSGDVQSQWKLFNGIGGEAGE